MSKLRELRDELHYYQTMVRVDIRSLRAGIRKCKEIGAKMREIQNPRVEFLERRPKQFSAEKAKQESLL